MGLFTRKDQSKRKLNELIGSGHVPAFPGTVTKILDKLRDPDSSMAEIAEAVGWDPGLVVRILKTVNSAAYGLRREVSNAAHAVGFLGRSNLESLVLGLTVEKILPRTSAPGFDAKRYWQTAATRAALARNLAERLHPATQAEAFTVGLLQDMAVPVLVHAKPAEYGQVLAHWHATRDADLQELERTSLGWHHGDLGATLCEAWELPESLTQGIRCHHPGAGGTVQPAVALVALMRENDQDDAFERLVEEAHSSYELEPDWTVAALERARLQARDLVRQLG